MLRACLYHWNKLRAFLDAYLDPSEQLTELLVGLLMVLICMTMARKDYLKDAADAQKGKAATKEDAEDEREARNDAMEWVQLAPGCNITWGLITGLMIIMNNIYDRSRASRLQQEVRAAASEAEALAVVQDELDEDLAALTSAEERQALYLQIVRRIEKVDMPRTTVEGKDFVAGLIILGMMALTALPAFVPYLFDEKDLLLGIRVANGVLVPLLFVVGYCWGRLVRINAWAAGATILVMSLAMVGVAEVIGG